MALERRQFIGLDNDQALEFTGIDREITVNTSKPTLRVHTSLVPHGVNLATENDANELASRLDSDEVSIQNLQRDLGSLDGRMTQAEYDLLGKQATLVSGTNIKTINSTSLLGSEDISVQPTLVSGTNIKTINNISLLGSGNIDIQGGGSGSQTKVIRQVIQPTAITWTATSSSDEYGATYYGEVVVSNNDIEASKSYLPIVLFDALDTKTNARLKSQCTGAVQSAGSYRLLIYSDSDNSPNVLFAFNLILIEITNDSGDSSSTISHTSKGLTNANNAPQIVQVNSLPASPSANAIYLIPESQEVAMPIYYGSTKIGQIYSGSSEISEVYASSVKVFSKAAQPIPVETLLWNYTTTSTYGEFPVPETGWYRCEFVSGGCGAAYATSVHVQSFLGASGAYAKKWIYIDKSLYPNAVLFATVGAGSAGTITYESSSYPLAGGDTVGGLKDGPNGNTLASYQLVGGQRRNSGGGYQGAVSGIWNERVDIVNGQPGERTSVVRVSPYDGLASGYGAGGSDSEYDCNGKPGFFRVYKSEDPYPSGQTIFESSTPGTYSVVIPTTKNYKVTLVGGGAGGWTHNVLSSNYAAGGSSGAMISGTTELAAGTYTLVIGAGSAGECYNHTGDYNIANGGDTSFVNQVAGGGIGHSETYPGTTNPTTRPGGSATVSLAGLTGTNGNSAVGQANGKSVYDNTDSGYGAGGGHYYNDGFEPYNGVNGYAKIEIAQLFIIIN